MPPFIDYDNPLALALPYLVWGLVAHLVADWFLQNEWMALNKTSLKHPAAWVHSFIHFCLFLPLFGLYGALVVFGTHLLIDTRVPLTWWGRVMRQTSNPKNRVTLHLSIWRDQVAHVIIVAVVSLLLGMGILGYANNPTQEAEGRLPSEPPCVSLL
jgi:hypothetical protein